MILREWQSQACPQSDEVNSLCTENYFIYASNDNGEISKYSLDLEKCEILYSHGNVSQTVIYSYDYVISGGADFKVHFYDGRNICKTIDTQKFSESSDIAFNPPFVTTLMSSLNDLYIGLGNGTVIKYNFLSGNVSSLKFHNYSVVKL